MAAACLTVPAWAGEPPAGPSDPAREVARTSAAFATGLYAALKDENKIKGNLSLSPYSVSTALAMVQAGAAGETAEEIATVLHMPATRDTNGAGHRDLADHIGAGARRGGYQISVANALFGQRDFGFLAGYIRNLREQYGSNLSQVDFAGDPEGARQQINRWAQQRTNDKIRDLLPMDVVDHLTRFVLVNAIYFKGEWEHRFDRTMTRDAPFDTGGGQIIRVPMMFANERLSYLAWDEAQAIELPYRGRDLSMVILLPRSHDGLVKLERRLTAEKLTEWLARLSAISPRKVPTYLPKFKTTSSFSLAPSLSKMGMTRAFTTAADFSGIDGNKDLFLAAAVHKVFVEVNEDGTEAAAATGVVGARHKGEEATIFKADHPFVFLIKDRQTGLILFFGRIVNPKQEALM